MVGVMLVELDDVRGRFVTGSDDVEDAKLDLLAGMLFQQAAIPVKLWAVAFNKAGDDILPCLTLLRTAKRKLGIKDSLVSLPNRLGWRLTCSA